MGFLDKGEGSASDLARRPTRLNKLRRRRGRRATGRRRQVLPRPRGAHLPRADRPTGDRRARAVLGALRDLDGQGALRSFALQTARSPSAGSGMAGRWRAAAPGMAGATRARCGCRHPTARCGCSADCSDRGRPAGTCSPAAPVTHLRRRPGVARRQGRRRHPAGGPCSLHDRACVAAGFIVPSHRRGPPRHADRRLPWHTVTSRTSTSRSRLRPVDGLLRPRLRLEDEAFPASRLPMWRAPTGSAGRSRPAQRRVHGTARLRRGGLHRRGARRGRRTRWRVTKEKAPIDATSWWAAFADPDGNDIGLYESTPTARWRGEHLSAGTSSAHRQTLRPAPRRDLVGTPPDPSSGACGARAPPNALRRRSRHAGPATAR